MTGMEHAIEQAARIIHGCAVDRARTPEALVKARKDLAQALRLKDQWKATRR